MVVNPESPVWKVVSNHGPQETGAVLQISDIIRDVELVRAVTLPRPLSDSASMDIRRETLKSGQIGGRGEAVV
jgi:hypothetical protein